MRDKTILVIGGTGRQGGASARHLLAEGFPVRAIVRDALKPAARALAEVGAELMEGDLDDPASIARAMDGVYGVHSVQAYMPDDPQREVRQGTAVIDAARGAGVEHFVYSSAAGADRGIGIPETESKWRIEEHLRTSGVPATILRPAYFMNNLELMKPWILQGAWSMSLPADRAMQMVAAGDIGAFVALAFARPAEFVGHALELAGDELTMLQVADTLSRAIGRAVYFNELPLEQTRAFDANLAKLCEWMATHSFVADLPSLRTLLPGLQTLETWLTNNGWRQPAGATRSNA